MIFFRMMLFKLFYGKHFMIACNVILKNILFEGYRVWINS